MAQRGRKPKPTAVKVLEGNPGKRGLNAGEPKPEKKAPRCPAWLEAEAKKEWKRMAKQMERLGILTEIDMAAFAGYWEGAECLFECQGQSDGGEYFPAASAEPVGEAVYTVDADGEVGCLCFSGG